MNERDLELLDAWRHGMISEDDFRMLEKRLEAEPELRAALRAMADVEEGLSGLATQPLPMGTVVEIEHTATRPVFAYAGWVVAATIFVACGIWSYVLVGSQSTTAAKKVKESAGIVFADARVTNLIDVEWSDEADHFTYGQAVDGKWIRLESGIAQVEFSSGAQLALQGPAELRVDSDMECFLQSGKLTVLAPPEATRFTVKSPTGNVIDLGTEFGVVVDANGHMDVHVLDGEVELEVGDEERRRLVENEAATIDPTNKQIHDMPIDRASFDPIRHETLLANKPLKIQFDCGIRAGVYQGIESPAHAAGDIALGEVYWNGLYGDQSGRFLLADGSVSPMALEIDYGETEFVPASKRTFTWDVEPQLVRSAYCQTRGVFDTALGKDRLSSGGTVGLRIKGLPVGKYRVYFIARSVDDTKRGNYLVLKGYRVVVGTNLSEVSRNAPAIMPLDDPDAQQWVAGQTHHVSEVELAAEDEYLTLLVRRDPALSPQKGGGGTAIVGVQIVQID